MGYDVVRQGCNKDTAILCVTGTAGVTKISGQERVES